MLEQELLDLTPFEELPINGKLNRLYPNPDHKDIVEFEGTKYQVNYVPLQLSNSRKTVMDWGKKWKKISPPPPPKTE